MTLPVVLQLNSPSGLITYYLPFSQVRYWTPATKNGDKFSRVYIVGKTAGLLVQETPEEIEQQLYEVYSFANKVSQHIDMTSRKQFCSDALREEHRSANFSDTTGEQNA